MSKWSDEYNQLQEYLNIKILNAVTETNFYKESLIDNKKFSGKSDTIIKNPQLIERELKYKALN